MEDGNGTKSLRMRSRDRLHLADSIQNCSLPSYPATSSTRSGKDFFSRLTLLFATALAALSTIYLGYLYSVSHVYPLLSTHSTIIDATSITPHSLDFILQPDRHVHRNFATIRHRWRVTAGFRSPDGVQKQVYLVNDAFPGPTIEARSGDWLIIEVENALQHGEGLSIHCHGLYMRDANRMDGAVGFTQDPIPAGSKFTYRFQIAVDQHGSFWYHAHDQVQRADGLFGGLIVHRPGKGRAIDPAVYDYDEERLLLVRDWYHRTGKDVQSWYMRAGSFGMEPVPDSVLINGVGAFNCSNAVPARPLVCAEKDSGMIPHAEIDALKRYRFRIVNTGTLGGLSLRIPSANMSVLTVDGDSLINGTSTQSVGILYPGERVDVIITMKSASTLEIKLDDENFNYRNPALTRTHYFPIHVSSQPQKSTVLEFPVPDHFDLQTAKSLDFLDRLIPETANLTLLLYTNTLKLSRLSNIPHGFINHTSWKPQSPFLLSLPRPEWNSDQFVPNIPLPGAGPIWIDLIINNLDDGGHPFHLHGNDIFVLQTYASEYGWGSYNPFEMEEPPGGIVDLSNAVRRDTWFVPRRGYTIVRFRADNVGLWMLHCHMLWHQGSGMAMGIEVGP